MYQILTELTVIFHLLFILFVLIGGFFVRKRLWATVVHLGCVAWGVYAELASGVVCPLTTLENYFGYRAGLATYEDDFVTRYLVPVIYQENLTPVIQYVLVLIVILINLIAYRPLWKKWSPY